MDTQDIKPGEFLTLPPDWKFAHFNCRHWDDEAELDEMLASGQITQDFYHVSKRVNASKMGFFYRDGGEQS